MPSFAPKRAVLYRFDRQPVEAYIDIASLQTAETLEFLTASGSLEHVPHPDVKAVCLITERGELDLFRRNNLFERRPKVAGLWTRFVLRDGDRLDGILPYNLLDWPESSFVLTPPRAGPNRQRVYLPRAALIGTELRGVVGRSSVAASLHSPPAPGDKDSQLRMFDR